MSRVPIVAGVDSGRDLPDDFEDLSSVGPRLVRRDRIIDQISPYSLWVGHGGEVAGRPSGLYDHGIEAVVQLAAEELPLSTPRELLYHRFPLLDGSGNRPEVLMLAVGTVATLLRLRVPTLVCCGMGLSRSPAVASVALAIVRRERPDDVLRMVSERHPVDISPGFWKEIRTVQPIATGSEAVEAGRQPSPIEATSCMKTHRGLRIDIPVRAHGVPRGQSSGVGSGRRPDRGRSPRDRTRRPSPNWPQRQGRSRPVHSPSRPTASPSPT